MLAQAIEAEVAEFLAGHAERRDGRGRVRVVRNGYLPERMVQTGIGAISVKDPAGAGSSWGVALHVVDPAAVPAAHEDDGRVVAVAVPEGDLDRRFL